MPTVEKNYSYFLNGTRRPGAEDDPSVLSDALRDADAPGEGRVQSLSELWEVLKNVKSPRLFKTNPHVE